MSIYRLCFTGDDGDHVQMPKIIECVDDQDAVSQAAQHTNGHAVELWRGVRLIMRLPKDDPT